MENKKGYAMNHHPVATDPNLTFRDYWVYGMLQYFRNGDTGRCYPAYKTITKHSNKKIQRTAIYESVVALEKAGYLKVSRKKGNVSFFTFPLLAQPIRYSERGAPLQRTSPVRQSEYKQEVLKKKYVNKAGLRFGKDPAKALPDGEVVIFTPSQQRWLHYGGGDDERFTYKDLKGTDARRAAIADARTAETPPP